MDGRPSDNRAAIREEEVQGLECFRKLWPLFERLRDVGCQRDKAGNRELFMDQLGGACRFSCPRQRTAESMSLAREREQSGRQPR
jgi:hypothetical protein